jgi:hypothetical protein
MAWRVGCSGGSSDADRVLGMWPCLLGNPQLVELQVKVTLGLLATLHRVDSPEEVSRACPICLPTICMMRASLQHHSCLSPPRCLVLAFSVRAEFGVGLHHGGGGGTFAPHTEGLIICVPASISSGDGRRLRVVVISTTRFVPLGFPFWLGSPATPTPPLSVPVPASVARRPLASAASHSARDWGS